MFALAAQIYMFIFKFTGTYMKTETRWSHCVKSSSVLFYSFKLKLEFIFELEIFKLYIIHSFDHFNSRLVCADFAGIVFYTIKCWHKQIILLSPTNQHTSLK